jgi:hypothetical protein
MWEQKVARKALDECHQDLFEAKQRLAALEGSTEKPDSAALANARRKLNALEEERIELLADWKLHTLRSYYPQYTEDWRLLSRKLREENGWRCSRCRADLSLKRTLLHVHHANGIATDNRRGNLVVICALCHSEEHIDYQIVLSAEDVQFILNARPAGENH